MPYKFETKKLKLKPADDRRRKLTKDDKKEIIRLYSEGAPIRQIALLFADKCTRRNIQFILFPERIEKTRINRDWRNYYTKGKHAKCICEHRRYKQTKKDNLL